MLPVHLASPSEAATLLDLLALADTSEVTVATLVADPPTSRESFAAALCPAGDYSTRSTISALLGDLGVAIGPVDEGAVTDLVAKLALASQLQATIVARAPAPRSSLVVTATGSPALQHLQRALAFIPLFQLVEDVVRSAMITCWLGAPYWNADAIERLRPALYGFAHRGGGVEFVCQGSAEAGEADPLPVLCRAASDVVGEGGGARVWAFSAQSASGRPLLLHAKFALADRTLGYLGSANMTRQGFGDHLEIGTRLPEVEADHLVNFLEGLCGGDLLKQHYP
jgi:hypothetical protein